MSDGDEGDAGGMKHLLPVVRKMIGCSTEERVLFARQDRWIGYVAADEAIKKLSDLLASPLEERPRGLLLAARADNGKSSLLRRFKAINPATSIDTGEAVIPVVFMSMPDEPIEPKFWMALLKALKIPYRVTDSPKVHKSSALEILETIGCRMLLLDEIHNLLEGSAKQSSHALTMLKSLSNELSLRLVAAGTENALTALETDDQITTRFELSILPPWRLTAQLRSFLKGMESVLPLAEPSGLDTREMVQAISSKAGMTIGGYVKLLQAATVQAIRTGKERLDPVLIASVDVGTLATRDRSKPPDI